jgi:hypothetical protein
LTGGVSLNDQLPDHPSIKFKGEDTNWVSMKSRGEVLRLSNLKAFSRFSEHFYNHEEFIELKRIDDSLAPQEEALPASMANYNAMHQLCVL